MLHTAKMKNTSATTLRAPQRMMITSRMLPSQPRIIGSPMAIRSLRVPGWRHCSMADYSDNYADGGNEDRRGYPDNARPRAADRDASRAASAAGGPDVRAPPRSPAPR